MTKNILKYLFLFATAVLAACSSDDNDVTSAAPTLSEAEVNVDYDVTFYSLSVTSRAVWNATVENGGEWLKLVSGKGVGGNSEKLSFEMMYPKPMEGKKPQRWLRSNFSEPL